MTSGNWALAGMVAAFLLWFAANLYITWRGLDIVRRAANKRKGWRAW